MYYKLIPECDKGSEIYVSVKNGEKKMRRPISKEQAIQMVQEIPKVKGIWISDDRARENAYKEAIVKGDYEEMMGMLAGLFEKRNDRIKQGKRQTELDDRIFRNTKKVFLGELSVVLDMDIDFLEEEIMKQVGR